MTKAEKIIAIKTAMTIKKRDDGTEFYCFSDSAPEELKSLFLEHWEVRDLDYQTFNEACSLVSEIYEEKESTVTGDSDEERKDQITEAIYERASDSASVYTSDRLSYISMWNESDISDIMREYDERSIATACAIWYDKQVEQQAIVINEWVNK